MSAKKLTAGIGGASGLGLIGWSGWNALQLANGTAPLTSTNIIMSLLPLLAGGTATGIAGIAMWARHIALVVLAFCDIDDPAAMKMISDLAAMGEKPSVAPSPDAKQLAKELAEHLGKQ